MDHNYFKTDINEKKIMKIIKKKFFQKVNYIIKRPEKIWLFD